MIHRLAPLALLPLAACMPPPQSTPAPPVGAKCNAEPAAKYVGAEATQRIVEDVVADTGSRNARVIRPGQMVTMDYREDRVNIHVDAKNVIESIRCG